MKKKLKRKAKRAAKREIINYVVNSIPAPAVLKRFLKSMLSTFSLNLIFATALAFIVFWFVSGA